MPFIETDFVKFIVLVIPGILGMWVYKPFVYRGDDREHGHHDTAIALILGLCGYLAALTVPGLLGFEGGLMTSVCVSCVTSVVVAASAGFIARHGFVAAYLPAKGDSALTGALEDTAQGRVLELIYSRELDAEADHKARVHIAKVYKLDAPEKAQIGQVCQLSFKHNELGLSCYPHLPLDWLEKNRERVSVWAKVISLDGGTVTEIAAVERGFFDAELQKEFDGYYTTEQAS